MTCNFFFKIYWLTWQLPDKWTLRSWIKDKSDDQGNGLAITIGGFKEKFLFLSTFLIGACCSNCGLLITYTWYINIERKVSLMIKKLNTIAYPSFVKRLSFKSHWRKRMNEWEKCQSWFKIFIKKNGNKKDPLFPYSFLLFLFLKDVCEGFSSRVYEKKLMMKWIPFEIYLN